MIAFIFICTLLALGAAALLAWPLLKKPLAPEQKRSLPSAIVVALLIPIVTGGLYVSLTKWNWQEMEQGAARQATIEEMVGKLEQRLQQTPDDLQGWLMLGRSYATLEKPAQAAQAYERAYNLSDQTSTEAAIGLGEALAMTDEGALRGRAGDLFEIVLKREPAHPMALWYGAVAALSRNQLPLAKQRITTLLSLNPPEQARQMLERQLQDIDQQMGAGGVTPDKPQRILTVNVSLAPALQGKIDKQAPLFVLARGEGGPPLAVVRRAAGDLPLTVTLSDRDAMIAGRSIATTPQVDVVARISKSGSPQAQSGDLFGQLQHRFKSPTADTVSIVIDSVAP